MDLWRLRLVFHLALDFLGLEFSYLEVNTQECVKAHVEVGHPDEPEERDDVATPVEVKQFETSESQEDSGNVVAEAVLAGEKIEKFSLYDVAAFLAAADTVLSNLSEHLLMRDRPRNRRNGDGKNEQPDNLGR